jgi:glycosyltransferase involved in cell wall biosynthesis
MKCLFFASWWPLEDSPVSGIFIKEHAEAVAMFSEIVIVHIKPTVERKIHWRNFPFRLESVAKKVDGIDTHIVTIYVAVRRFGLYRFAIGAAMKSFFRELNKKYLFDIVNINILRNEFAETFLEAKVLPELPVVITENSSYYYSEINLLDSAMRKQKQEQLIRLLNSPRVKKILPVSQHLAQNLVKEYNVKEDRISVTPNIANDYFTFREGVIRESEKCKIVMVAHWSYPKNPFAFIEYLNTLSSEALSKLHVDWFGGGPQMDEIISKSKTIKREVIRFHGYKDKSVIADCLRDASFLFHPSDKENLPCIVIESLCCGTPVLSNNVRGVNELIDDTNGILIPINDVSAVAGGIESMMYKQLQFDRKKISEVARGKFSKDVVGKKIYSVYKRVVDLNELSN